MKQQQPKKSKNHNRNDRNFFDQILETFALLDKK